MRVSCGEHRRAFGHALMRVAAGLSTVVLALPVTPAVATEHSVQWCLESIASAEEGSSHDIVVRASQAVPADAVATLEVVEGSAREGDDFSLNRDVWTQDAQSAPRTFQRVVRSGDTVTIPLVDDDVAERSEEYFAGLRGVPTFTRSVGTPCAPEQTATIVDNDPVRITVSAPEFVRESDRTVPVRVAVPWSPAAPLPLEWWIEACTPVGDPLSPGGVSCSSEPDIADSTGGAAEVSDYVGFTQARPGALVIAPQTSSVTVHVPVVDDDRYEPTDGFVFRVALAEGAGAAYRAPETGSLVDILDDDAPPSLVVPPAKVVEGHAADVERDVPVYLVGLTEFDTVVDVAPGPGATGTATAGIDYLTSAAPVVFPGEPEGTAAQRSRPAHVTVRGDRIPEPDETLFLNLSSPHAATIREDAVTIIDDDVLTLVADDVNHIEGTGGGASTAIVTVRRLGPVQASVTFAYRTVDLGDARDPDDNARFARAGRDYVAVQGQVTIPSNVGHSDIRVPVVADGEPEPDRPFGVVISDARAATVGSSPSVGSVPVHTEHGDGRVEVTITDDDVPALLQVGDATVVEGDRAGSYLEFPLTITGVPAQDVVVEFRTVDGTATGGSPSQAGADHQQVEGRWVISRSVRQSAIYVPVFGDAVDEEHETMRLEVRVISGTGQAGGAPLEGIGRIEDDDSTVTLDPGSELEGDEGHVPLVLVARLANPSTRDVAFGFVPASPSGTTATSGTDYVVEPSAQRIVVIPAGETAVDVVVPIVGDTDVEGDETFLVTLNDPSAGARLGSPHAAIATIVDDDEPVGPEPTISITDVSVVEGNSGVTSARFTVTRTGATSESVTVSFATADVTATAGSDYRAASGQVTVPGGGLSATATVTVEVLGDVVDEPDESFEVRLSTPSRGTISRGTATGTIIDDDGPVEPEPTISIADVSVVEGNSGVTSARFTVTRTGATSVPVTVSYTTADVTATAGSDYRAATGQVTVPAGGSSATATVTIDVLGDVADEPDETFQVRLSNPSGGTISRGTATGTIRDDDDPPAGGQNPGGGTNAPPSVEAGPDRTLDTYEVATFSAEGSDPEGGVLTYRWDFGDGSPLKTGKQVTYAYSRRGSFTVTVTATDPANATATDRLTVQVVDGGQVTRVSGSDRVGTSVAASQAHWPAASAGGRSPSAASTAPATDAVLARSDDFADALAAGALVASLDAPLMLTPRDQLAPAVRDELSRLGVRTVWLLGGTAALSPGVQSELEQAGYTVKRVGGADRFETARLVAAQAGASATGDVVLALGAHPEPDRAWADALSAGALTASPDRLPLLLTTRDTVPPQTETGLRDLGAKRVILIGGTSAISSGVEQRLQQLGYATKRLGGADRFATSALVAADALARHSATAQVPVVAATGLAFPDGLAASAVAARLGGIVVLVPRDDMPPGSSVRTWLEGQAERIDVARVLGGTAAVSTRVADQIAQAIRAA